MIGIDMGIHHLLTLSNGVYIDVPNYSQEAIEYACEVACSYGEDLVIEKLNLFTSLEEDKELPRLVTAYLTEEANRQGLTITTVSARNTSKVCSNCNAWVSTRKNRRVYCYECELLECRDINAAINILKAGQGLFKPRPKQDNEKIPFNEKSTYKLETVVDGLLYRQVKRR
jgi:transposase